MSEIVKIVKRREVIKKKAVFKIDKIYSKTKDEIKNRRYEYTEKERTLKQTKKGDFFKAILLGQRKFDDLVKFHIQVELIAENIKQGKRDEQLTEMGDFKAVLSAWLELDFLNKWNKNAAGKFLFKVYMDYIIKSKIDHYYAAKLLEDVNEIHDILKEQIE